jgi:hypothetical protein
MSDRDVDAQFADIVAHWDEVESLPDAPELPDSPELPDAPAVPDSPKVTEREGVNPPLVRRPSPTNPPPVGPFVVWRGAQPEPVPSEEPQEVTAPAELSDLEDDEHFQPGPTAPLPPQEDIQFWGIIVGLVAGPLLLLWLVLFRPSVSSWWTVGALALTIGGFILLVLRQPHERDEDDPDNGARV